MTQNRNVENICNGGVAQRQSLRAMRAPYSLCGVCAASLVELEDEQPVQQCMMIGTSTCHDKVRSTVAICSEWPNQWLAMTYLHQCESMNHWIIFICNVMPLLFLLVFSSNGTLIMYWTIIHVLDLKRIVWWFLLLGKHFKCFKNFASCSCSCSMSFLICMFLMQILDCRSQMWIAAWVQLDTVVCLVIWAGSDIPVLVRTLQVKRYYHFSSPGAHTKTTCLTVDL